MHQKAQQLLEKCQILLRLQDWNIHVQMVDKPWRKTGDIKIDAHDKKAILLINAQNPHGENLEEVVIHELLHIKLWGLDQMLETLLESVFGNNPEDAKYQFAYNQFMDVLESTVQDLTKTCLELGADDKTLSFGRVQASIYKELKD